MLKIKLIPTGKKHNIQYRIGVSEARSKNSNSQIASFGYYRPKSKELVFDQKLLKFWQEKGAQITEGLANVLKTWKTSSHS